MKDLFIKLGACKEFQVWASDKTWLEVYNTCERGDWLLWLFVTTNPDDLQLLILAKGHMANTVRHLMKDARSIKAVDVVIAFGEGRATRDELDAAADDADDAYTAAYTAAYDADAYDAYVDAAYAAACVAAVAIYVADVDSAVDAYEAAGADDYYADTLIPSLKELAGIVRKYIPIEMWSVNN
jgi:hypothetical protein